MIWLWMAKKGHRLACLPQGIPDHLCPPSWVLVLFKPQASALSLPLPQLTGLNQPVTSIPGMLKTA